MVWLCARVCVVRAWLFLLVYVCVCVAVCVCGCVHGCVLCVCMAVCLHSWLWLYMCSCLPALLIA